MQKGRLWWLMVPARRLLRRLMRPWMLREAELFAELEEEDRRIDRRLAVVEDALAKQAVELSNLTHWVALLKKEIDTITARGWDSEAVRRRLATLEDQVISLSNESIR